MKLDEIKNGMYVKLRSGALALVVADKFMYENGNYNERQYYTDALTHTLNEDWDIMEVYVSASSDLFNMNRLERIWERDGFEPHVGDIYYDEDGDKYVAIIRIDEFDSCYPYVSLKYYKGELDSMEVEPYSTKEFQAFKFIKNSDRLSFIGDLTKELCKNGTI
jgi:hypothetical protein